MLNIFAGLRDITFASVVLRLILAVLCGGAIGMEREYKRRPAGFRTHILICLGAAMTTMTGHYLFLNAQLYTDVARLGAQVIVGVGFIGAGCVLVSKEHHVRGLTTAAGLWCAAIIGLAIGAGFYEAAIYFTALLLFTELILSRMESWLYRSSLERNLFVRYSGRKVPAEITDYLENKKITISNVQVENREEDAGSSCVLYFLVLNDQNDEKRLLEHIRSIENVQSAETF